jgi:phenylpyruvate tautomerase PptA (4-oxalocrotonate tautomerase family)
VVVLADYVGQEPAGKSFSKGDPEMPTYLCYAQHGALTPAQRSDIADRVTEIHSEVTGAPRFFVQVLFHELGEGGHFIGGRPADPRTVWVHGHIRAGRSDEAKNRLLLGIRDHVVAVADVPEHTVWVYLSDLAPTDMVEFGQVLPAPGKEQAWLDALPRDLRKQLLAFGESGKDFTL